jgi:NitT/TauT family transport system substrate-binding protein
MAIFRSRFLAGAAAGVVTAALPHAARAQSTTMLRVGTVPVQFYAAPYFSADAGAFAKAGFDMAITNVNNGPQVAAALAGGSVDLGVIDLISAATAISKGIPLQLIAGSGMYHATQAWQVIAVAKDSPIKTARDLEGRTIAMVSIAGLALASTRGWLKQNGVDPAKVNFVEFQQPAMAAALTRKTFDAAFIGEPFIAFDKNGANEMRVIGHPLDCIGDGFAVSCWFAAKSWVEQNRDRTSRVVAAIYDTARWANAHKPETLAILAKATSINPDLLRGLVRVDYATATTPATLQPMLNIGFSEKLTPAIEASTLLRS